jgi:hypothetical protein
MMKNVPGSINMPQLYPVLWLVTPQWGRCVKGTSTTSSRTCRRSPKQRMQNYEEAARSSPHPTSCLLCRLLCTAHGPRGALPCPAMPCGPLLICWQTCGGERRDGGKLGVPAVAVTAKVAHPCRRRLCMFCQTSSRERRAEMQIATSGPA